MTGAGSTSTAYDAAVLLQPPIVGSVTPSAWNTTGDTVLTIMGER